MQLIRSTNVHLAFPHLRLALGRHRNAAGGGCAGEAGAGESAGEVGVAFAAGVALTAILSVVAVIYSSRKTGEAQPIVTVEDFWGGLLVGFLMGFLGNEFFGKLVPIGTTH